MRRIQRRMQITQRDTPEAYIERLRQDPGEVGALFRDLLINVTNFFRDADAFGGLKKQVIPKLFEGRDDGDVIRIWIPGCATGEEVYSVGILMREQMDTLENPPQVQIFATDIDEHALSVARAARYPEALLDSISPERRERFFLADGGSYQVAKEVRDLCVFSPHSVIRDPPFSRIDLVSCRNLLIYFGLDMQNQVVPTFHYSLRPGGYLFLGTSENVSQFSDLFAPLDKKHRIFRKRDDAAPVVRVPMLLRGLPDTGLGAAAPRLATFSGIALRSIVDAQVIHHHAPPHVVINKDGEVVYYSPRTGKYLEPPQGVPSRQLMAMARKGLRLDLRTLLKEAVETHQIATREGIAVEMDDDRVQLVNLTIDPLAERADGERLFLVLFTDDGPLATREEAFGRAAARTDEAALHVERELRDTRDRLQGMIEEYETAVEELKSSNEELVSVNEELQSSNEELESSKEEMQSLNEELHTVNAELTSKVDELDRANSDLQNLFESTQVATVFLDRDLIIRSFTPAVSTVFHIRPGDRGRPLTDFASRLPLPTLREDVRTVLTLGSVIERKVDTENNGASYLMRLIPYRDPDDLIDGVVVTFVDVSSLSRAEAQQRVLVAELNHRVKNMLTIAIAVAQQTGVEGQSTETFRTTLIDRLQAMGRSYGALSRENWLDVSLSELLDEELAPFGPDRLTLDGLPLRLKPRPALSLGMVFHELATNAGKYGALSVPDGKVQVSWTYKGGLLVLVWRETGGPAVVKPDSHGFGLKLVQREMAYNLNGDAQIAFERDGLAVRLRCPL